MSDTNAATSGGNMPIARQNQTPTIEAAEERNPQPRSTTEDTKENQIKIPPQRKQRTAEKDLISKRICEGDTARHK